MDNRHDIHLYTRDGDAAEPLPQVGWLHVGKAGDIYIDGVLAYKGPCQVFVGRTPAEEIERQRKLNEYRGSQQEGA